MNEADRKVFSETSYFSRVVFTWALAVSFFSSTNAFTQTLKTPVGEQRRTTQGNGVASIGLAEQHGLGTGSSADPIVVDVQSSDNLSVGRSTVLPVNSAISSENASQVDMFPTSEFESENLDVGHNSNNDVLSNSSAVDLFLSGPQSWFSSDNGWFGRSGISTTIKTLLITSAFSLAPALLLITTSYIRISVVLSLLRQAIGAGQIPSNQVIAVLSIFLTCLVMSPVWTDVYQNALVPYSQGTISSAEALKIGQDPIRTFLWKQIERSGNAETIGVFDRYLPENEKPQYYEDVPWRVLAPAFVLSELKTAFLIGFQIFLPFLIIDVVVSCVLVSSGMMMLPPSIVSLPFKLALFVLVDGWTLAVKSLIGSFA